MKELEHSNNAEKSNASQVDIEPIEYLRRIIEGAVVGHYPTGQFPPGGILSKNDVQHPEFIVPGTDKAATKRFMRNRMLRESDYTQLADVMGSMSRDEQAAWRLYRQELRDLPSLPNWPLVDFPTPPNYKGE